MAQFTTNAQKFADLFNAKVPGAYRSITAQDIRDMVDCGLIKKWGGFYSDDLQTVIGMLNYEQMREKRTKEQTREVVDEPTRCKLCGQVLLPKAEGKKGRPKEYCPGCESSRATMRGRKWRRKMKAARN